MFKSMGTVKETTVSDEKLEQTLEDLENHKSKLQAKEMALKDFKIATEDKDQELLNLRAQLEKSTRTVKELSQSHR